MDKFTPGEWRSEENPARVTVFDGECNSWLKVARVFGEGAEESRANARLMAASKDTYKALKYLITLADAKFVTDEEWDAADEAARMALDKAEGSEQ